MQKNVAGQKIGAQMVSATDGSAFTGSVTVYVTGDAGTQGAGSVGSGACTSEGNGYHSYAPSQAETNYDLVAFTFIGTGAIPTTVQVYTVPANFPALAITAGGIAKADVDTIKTQAVTCTAGVTVLASVGTAATSTAQTGDSFARIGALGAGLTGITGVTLAASQPGVTIPTVTTLTNLPAITSNWLTAAGIAASALDGKGNWNVGKTGYTLTATTGLGNQTANLTGNVSGSVGSVTGAVGSVTGAVGSVTAAVTLPTIPANWIAAAGIAASALNGKGDWNVGKTGYALTATTGLGNQTANITGNLSGSVGSVTGAVGSVTGAVGSVTGAVGSVTGNVGGNVAGSVASVTANVNAVLANAAHGGAAATLQLGGAGGLTGAVTGNLSGSVGSVTGAVGSVTGAVGSVTGNVGGNVAGSVGSVTGAVGSVTAAVTLPTIPANWITAAGIAADAIGASELAADAATEIGTAVWAATGRDLSTTPPTAAAVADAVWDEVLSGHSGVGSTGAALAAAGGSGDPWATALPGSYGAGTAGYVLGTNVNATISSRMATYTQPTGFLATTFPSGTVASTTNITAGTVTAGTVSDKTGYSLATAPPTAAAIADAVWDEVQSGHTSAGTFGKYLDAAVSGVSTGGVSAADIADAVWDEAASGHVGAGSFGARVDAAVSSRSSHSAADVWAATTRTLSAGTNIVLAKGTGVTGFTDLDAAGVRTAVGLTSANLETQLSAIDTVVDSILDDTGTAGVVVAAGSKTGYTLAAAGLDSIVVETGVNARQALSVIAAATAGVVSGAETSTVVIKGANVATTRITASNLDLDGNRPTIVLTLPT
jgi:hypothetical protein